MANFPTLLTLKNFLSFIVGVCVIFLAVIPLYLPPESLQLATWRILIVGLASIGVGALLWQSLMASREEKEQWELLRRIEASVTVAAKAKLETPSDGPFLIVSFPTDDLFSDEIRDHYLFIRNIGNRAALDVQVATLSRIWNGNAYEAKFSRLQILEADGKPVPITPIISVNGKTQAIFSMKARISFSALLIGEDEQLMQYTGGEKLVHHISISYTDRGTRKTNSAIIGASYWGVGVKVSVEHQS